MIHPEWATKYKTKNTELRLIRGHYYLYKITSVWDPEKKRTKKVTLESLGTITQAYGLIPKGMSKKGPPAKGTSPLKYASEKSGFLDSFGAIDDPRSNRNQLHNIEEILLLTLCAVICGAEGWQDIEDYGKAKLHLLRQYFDYNNGIPSDDTIRRFYRAIDPSAFEKMFKEWVQGLANITQTKVITIGAEQSVTLPESSPQDLGNDQVIAIDGKSSRRSFDGNGNMLHMVSAFATEARIILGQEKVVDRSNEITAIPKLLHWLDIKDHIITIDAMGCQYALADLIVSKGGDYIFSLKGNQGSLSSDAQLYFEDADIPKPQSYTSYDKGHGRIETRECWVVTDVEWLKKLHPKWGTIKSIIMVKSTREVKIKGKTKITTENRYYVSSLTLPATRILKAIRSHWAIENTLHWVLDMSFNEDYSRIRKENAPHIMAIFRHIALNLLQAAKKERQSVKGLRKLCGWDDGSLQNVLASKSS